MVTGQNGACAEAPVPRPRPQSPSLALAPNMATSRGGELTASCQLSSHGSAPREALSTCANLRLPSTGSLTVGPGLVGPCAPRVQHVLSVGRNGWTRHQTTQGF